MNEEPSQDKTEDKKSVEYRSTWNNKAKIAVGGALAGVGLYETGAFLLSSDQAISPFSESDITASVHSASDYFGMPTPMTIMETPANGPAAVAPGDIHSTFDDVVTYDRPSMAACHIATPEELDMVMTHETAHRAFQEGVFHDFPLASHQEELACDFMAGLRAGQEGWDIDGMQDVFRMWGTDSEHPGGNLRADILEYASQIGEENPDITPAESLVYLENYLGEHQPDLIAQINTTQNILGEDLGIDTEPLT